MLNIQFVNNAWEEYLSYEDKKIQRKINELIKSISRTPFTGIGKPEPLKNNKSKWSRRINECDRLVYEIIDSTLVIYQCKGHYHDK